MKIVLGEISEIIKNFTEVVVKCEQRLNVFSGVIQSWTEDVNKACKVFNLYVITNSGVYTGVL